MKKNVLIWILAGALALIATPSIAKEGVYLGGGLVYNNMLDSDLNFVDPAIGYGLKLGFNFGSIALEGNLIKSTHDDTDPGYGDIDFTGLSADLKIFFSQAYDPTQVYLLIGLGSYTLEEFDPFFFGLFGGANVEIEGTGMNLGLGFEHYFNPQVSLNVGAIYRLIEYDEITGGGLTAGFSSELDGDMLSIEVGLNLHF